MSALPPSTICLLCAHVQRAGARTEHATNGVKCLARQTSAAIVGGSLVRRYPPDEFDAEMVMAATREEHARTQHVSSEREKAMNRALDCGVLRYVVAGENPPSRVRRWAVVPKWFHLLESQAAFAGPHVLHALPLILTAEVRAALIAMSDLEVPYATLSEFAGEVVRASRFAQPGITDEDVEAWHR